MEFDELLTSHVGEFGKYQLLLYASFPFICFSWLPAIEIVFQSIEPEYICKTPVKSGSLFISHNKETIG